MTDQKYMQLAIDIAKLTIGQTSPNPSVGAIIVKDGAIISLGAHFRAGENHAETNAITHANLTDLEGATLYITLEPCCHHGRTTPCTTEILKNKFKRVVIATLDPNPLISGNGVKALKDAGIQIDVGVLEKEALNLNKMFFYYITTRLPFVTIKTGMSLDAKLATSTNDSKWITSNLSREDAHQYRRTHDAILVGIDTIIIDNPSLTTRLSLGGKNPIRIILDTELRTPLTSQIVTDGLSKTIIVTGSLVQKDKLNKFKKTNVEILCMSTAKIEIKPLLEILGQREICSVLIEGGMKVINSFIEYKMFNELITYISPSLIGGETAPTFFSGNGFAKLTDALKLEFTQIEQIGQDIKIISKPILIS